MGWCIRDVKKTTPGKPTMLVDFPTLRVKLKDLWNTVGYIPSFVMIPQRRFATLLDQAMMHQQSLCLYHNSPNNSRTFSLYTDHLCDQNAFPRVTSAILAGHNDEVWNLAWSHDGKHLATAGSDKMVIIWRIGVSPFLHSEFEFALAGTQVLCINLIPFSPATTPVQGRFAHTGS